MNLLGPFSVEVSIVVPPVMWQVGPDQYDIARVETFDMIAYKLSSAAFVEKY